MAVCSFRTPGASRRRADLRTVSPRIDPFTDDATFSVGETLLAKWHGLIGDSLIDEAVASRTPNESRAANPALQHGLWGPQI